ncbi:MAG: 3-phosphoshikimate 1-carboxyvinyltransferase, partial [Opitutus sp.]|nr:3-phosphoshikimate 1-carboxyvinyltransferase [Opitutus sp.]
MNALPEKLAIEPFARPVRGEVVPPGSKSLTNRALLLAALCEQPVTLTEALFSEDSLVMVEALRRLGFVVEENSGRRTLRVSGQADAFAAKRVELHVGLAGTAARFLTAFCAAAPRGTYLIDGTPRMRERPMRGVIDALRALGADISCLAAEGHLPIEIRAHGLRGGAVSIDASESSQFLSALLLVAPLARGPIEITTVGSLRLPFVELTARLMEQFGQPALQRSGADRFLVAPRRYSFAGDAFAVEPDASAASYLLALPLAVGGELVVNGLVPAERSLQGDIRFADVLRECGAIIGSHAHGTLTRWDRGSTRRGVTQDFSNFSDTFLTLAAIAPLLHGPTRISGVAHTRQQETDRVAGAAKELRKLGQHVVETADALEIHPRPLTPGVAIETYGDHRFAMSFGVLGCHDLHGNGRPWLTIRDPACCAKTFPAFFDL